MFGATDAGKPVPRIISVGTLLPGEHLINGFGCAEMAA